MKFHSETRPQIAYRPAYLSPSGRPIAPLPGILLVPHDDKHVNLVFWLLTSTNSATQFTKLAPLEDLSDFIYNYNEDPEECFKSWFGYQWEPPFGPRLIPKLLSTVVDLADLGL